MLLWVEVGLPESDRLIKASRHSARVALIAFGKAFSNWEQRHLSKLESVANLSVISFDHAFINRLAAKLDRSINWSATISDGTLYVNIGSETFETVFKMCIGNR